MCEAVAASGITRLKPQASRLCVVSSGQSYRLMAFHLSVRLMAFHLSVRRREMAPPVTKKIETLKKPVDVHIVTANASFIIEGKASAVSTMTLRDYEYILHGDAAQRIELTPPARAEQLLALMLAPDRLEEVLGDFEEKYHWLTARHSVRYAQNWYRWQVAMVAV